MRKALRWPFKSFTNFSITSIGIFAVTFWSFSVYSESKFNQPIIGESVKLLGKHNNVKELIGISYPIQGFLSLTVSLSAIAL